eukprot:CAMPEP_0194334692 /NCGR_PEP_ID=MMETSP0171-20130528/66990_1 /TAXON_ID=218684 /ORGANISM="Corethron pennatum, Strain L29A3" /LENGTH=139 /DNA_ID=CAMNT_0039097463 /DNA_START=78 /DNA_END=493 /DNA_ORIENTATION=-
MTIATSLAELEAKIDAASNIVATIEQSQEVNISLMEALEEPTGDQLRKLRRSFKMGEEAGKEEIQNRLATIEKLVHSTLSRIDRTEDRQSEGRPSLNYDRDYGNRNLFHTQDRGDTGLQILTGQVDKAEYGYLENDIYT